MTSIYRIRPWSPLVAMVALSGLTFAGGEDAPAPPTVVRDRIKGSINHGGGLAVLQRVVGKPRVPNANTLEFADGTRIELNLTTPEPGQMAMIGNALYPCGKEAAEFLTQLIGDRPAVCFRYAGGEGPWWGYVGDTNIKHAMIINGWALADHSSTQAAEAIARENRRGLWRGKFLKPADWRAGLRLPGEPTLGKRAGNRLPVEEIAQTHKAADPPRDNKPSAIVGQWNAIDRHVALGSLYQPVHGVRKRESVIRFKQEGNLLTGFSGTEDHKAISFQERWKDGRTDFRNISFADNQLTFEFDIGEWRKTAGPIAVEDGRAPNKGTIRMDARLEGARLIGRWRMLLHEGTEVFRGEWEAQRAADKPSVGAAPDAPARTAPNIGK